MSVTSALVLFGRNALTVKNDISSVSSSSVQTFVDLTDLETEVTGNKYITFEPDFWLLDGTYKFFPDVPHVGYMSLVQSGSGSDFSVAPTLTINFTSEHNTDGLTLYFNAPTNDYVDSITIAFYDDVNALIRSDGYTPSSAIFATNQVVTGFAKIIFTFNSTNKNYRYARLLSIDFDSITRFAGDEIKEARLVEEINLINIEVPSNSLELTLLSDTGEFSVVSPSSFFANLQYREPIEAFEFVDDEILFLGRYYLNHWKSETENKARFEAIDLMALASEIPNIEMYLSDTLVNQLDTVLVDRAELSYTLDDWIITNPPSYTLYTSGKNTREILQEILFAMSRFRYMFASCARSRVIEIKSRNYSVFNEDFTLTLDDIHQNAHLNLKPVVTAVELTQYNTTFLTVTETIFSMSLAAGDYILVLNDAPWDTSTFTPTNCTLTESNRMYVIINVPSLATVSLTGKRIVFTKETLTKSNPEVGTGNAESFIAAVDSIRAIFSPEWDVYRAPMLLSYFQKRYELNTKVFAPLFAPGDKVLTSVQGGKYLAGFVERMDTDLTGGFVSEVRIVGNIVDTVPQILTTGKVNDDHAALVYYGSWTDTADASAYNGDLHVATSGQVAEMTFAFIGTQFKIVYTRRATHGFMGLFIDDVVQSSINQNGATDYQHEYTSAVLANELHYVRITNSALLSIVDIDAIEIL